MLSAESEQPSFAMSTTEQLEGQLKRAEGEVGRLSRVIVTLQQALAATRQQLSQSDAAIQLLKDELFEHERANERLDHLLHAAQVYSYAATHTTLSIAIEWVYPGTLLNVLASCAAAFACFVSLCFVQTSI